jgi:diadenosine tetraphosphatase ApaH/serine/threonine PP2A family protein phosphatase
MARTLVLISDVHANMEALEAVLKDILARFGEGSEIYCLGDVVGYGPNPAECLRKVIKVAKLCLLGNHDSAALIDPSGFNDHALKAILWTRDILERVRDSDDLFGYVGELSSKRTEGAVMFVHGSPSSPMSEYVFPDDAFESRKMERVFGRFPKICFAGHTHHPGVFTKLDPPDTLQAYRFIRPVEIDSRFVLPPNQKAFINVGSVGQPRDEDRRACYATAVFKDDGSVEINWIRVEYDFETTAKKVEAIPALGEKLATRLRRGT